ncbi:hypothetical protein D3C81_585250 [compost metagenome]
MLDHFQAQVRQNRFTGLLQQTYGLLAGVVQGLDNPVDGVHGFASGHLDGFFLLAVYLQHKYQQATSDRCQSDQKGDKKLDQATPGVGVWNHVGCLYAERRVSIEKRTRVACRRHC